MARSETTGSQPTHSTTTAQLSDPMSADGSGETRAGQSSDQQEGPPLDISGAQLSEDELVALLTILGSLQTDEHQGSHGVGSTGPSDRTLQRRRHLGLWGRPGADSWTQAAGLR
jgi:hypothetical protein